MHHLDSAWVHSLGLALALTGLAAFAFLAVRVVLSRRRSARPVPMPMRLDGEREWSLVMRRATGELARAERVAELQAGAAAKIESAEYAYKRLVLDCARLYGLPAAPALEPARSPPFEPEAHAGERKRLAA